MCARRSRKPFTVRYVEIGNEDEFDRSHSYDARYAQFHDALKARYPKIQLIATMPVQSRRPDVVDDHYYRSADAFFKDLGHYDQADRKGPKIFVGEWATREGSPTPNFNAALGDAAWMTSMERNSDLIIMHAYAPLFVNVNPGGMQWKTDLIGYNAMTSYGSPAYYAQVMFSGHRGDRIVKAGYVDGPAEAPPYSVTRDSRTGRLYIKLVNRLATAQEVRFFIRGARRIAPEGDAVTLSAAAPTDTNSIEEPEKIVPVTSRIGYLTPEFTYKMAAYSIAVLEFDVK
jgi:alpha-N-arabinofuranosidase